MGLFRPFPRSSRPGDDRSRRGRAVNAEFLHERLPDSKLDFVDAGHFAYEDPAGEYAELILAWWNRGYEQA